MFSVVNSMLNLYVLHLLCYISQFDPNSLKIKIQMGWRFVSITSACCMRSLIHRLKYHQCIKRPATTKNSIPQKIEFPNFTFTSHNNNLLIMIFYYIIAQTKSRYYTNRLNCQYVACRLSNGSCPTMLNYALQIVL